MFAGNNNLRVPPNTRIHKNKITFYGYNFKMIRVIQADAAKGIAFYGNFILYFSKVFLFIYLRMF